MEEETETVEPMRRGPRDPTRRVSDAIPSGNLWPDLPRRELDDILDTDLVILDLSFLNGRYGQFAVVLCRLLASDQEFTTACGGQVVVRKLETLKEKRLLPILGMITYNERYYDLN